MTTSHSVYILLCLPFVTPYYISKLDVLCVPVVHLFSLLYIILLYECTSLFICYAANDHLVASSLGFMLKTSVNVLHVSQGMEACISIGQMPG